MYQKLNPLLWWFIKNKNDSRCRWLALPWKHSFIHMQKRCILSKVCKWLLKFVRLTLFYTDASLKSKYIVSVSIMKKIKISKWSAAIAWNNYFMTSLSNIALLKFVIVINGTYTVCENSISPVGVANDTYLAKHKQNSQYQNKWKLLYCVEDRETIEMRETLWMNAFFLFSFNYHFLISFHMFLFF